VLFAACLGFVLAWHPQTSATRDAHPDVDLRAESTLVVIPVTVMDVSNRYVLGLEKSNFSIFEDGVKQKISQFAAEEAPLSIGLLVDTSGSMGSKLGTSRQAVAEILNTLSGQDESFLVEFNDSAQLAVPFTGRKTEIEDKLASAESAGLTALLDAVELGLQEMKHARNARKALVLISDGGDNNSGYTPEQIQNLVRQADVQVYCMGVFEPFSSLGLGAAELSGPRLLTEIAEQTGGRAYPARSFAALPTIARKIAIELRNQYVLAYSPSRKERDGKYHKVDVKLTAPPGLSSLKAHWRLGYYAN
jgi:Ca-activated chloride channel homolog